jgi:hypothetical protein
LGIEKGYYADKEDAFKMKKYFKDLDREKDKGKIIELSSFVNFDEIKDAFEEVDINGEEKGQEDKEEEKKEDSEDKKKKKKKNKKK